MMEEIIRPREEEEDIIEFPNLKLKDLDRLPRLKSFFYCKNIINMLSDRNPNTSTFPVHSLFNAMVSFPQLKILNVSSCDENVIPFAMLQMLHNMETLDVQDCSSLKCIVNGAITATTEDQERSASEIIFPILKTLTLTSVPKLDNFWCTRSMGTNTDQHQHPPSLLRKVSFPRLENLDISLSFPLEEISLGDSAYQLRSLRICNTKLYPVFPSSWLVRLQNLEELRVVGISSDVSDLVELMEVNANLPGDHGIHDLLCFRRLKRLEVVNCNLSTLFTCSLAKTNFQQLKELFVFRCEKMEEIVRDENELGKKKMVATGTNAHADNCLIIDTSEISE